MGLPCVLHNRRLNKIDFRVARNGESKNDRTSWITTLRSLFVVCLASGSSGACDSSSRSANKTLWHLFFLRFRRGGFVGRLLLEGGVLHDDES